MEDDTKYGEFISSYFNWITLEEQKERTKKLENLTKDENCENGLKKEKKSEKGRKKMENKNI